MRTLASVCDRLRFYTCVWSSLGIYNNPARVTVYASAHRVDIHKCKDMMKEYTDRLGSHPQNTQTRINRLAVSFVHRSHTRHLHKPCAVYLQYHRKKLRRHPPPHTHTCTHAQHPDPETHHQHQHPQARAR